MSSWKKAGKATQKTHRERSQPESRQYYGLLEKKKDYVSRAKHFNANKETLKLLHKRALNKNPDEFYFHMINSQVVDGVHRDKEKVEEHTVEQMKLMQTQDLKYIAYKRNIESKKVQKLQSQLHMIDEANKTKNTHVFFVDEDEMKDFDVAKRLKTRPEFLEKRTNRPTTEMLEKMESVELDDRTLAKVKQQRHMAYKELKKRQERERELALVEQKLTMMRALKDKVITKPKKIRAGTKESAPVYKWKYQRKR